jgi:hypothetical protein
MLTTAHITMVADLLHAHHSDGTGYQGDAPAVAELLRARNIAADSVVMPCKDDPRAPTTGQQIAILHALRHHD